MFYLNQFFKSLLRTKIIGVLFILCTITLVTGAFHQDKISSIVSSVDNKDRNPYFNALISKDINLSSVARKIKSLPGVQRVSRVKKIDAKKELGTLNKELNSSVLDRLKSIKYSSLTIELSRNLKVKSQKLIKEYLGRLVGNESLTLSKIKYPRQNEETETIVDKVLKNADIIGLSTMSLLWIILFFTMLKRNSSYFFLVEKFQRKKRIKEKSLSIAVAFIVVISCLVNFYFSDDFSIASIGIILGLFIVSCFTLFHIKHKGPVN